MSKERELLELAAKACGMPPPYDKHGVFSAWVGSAEHGHWWSPLTDDGDALRLAYSTGLCVLIADGRIFVSRWYAEKQELGTHEEKYKIGDSAPVRLAIVRAAAEIGRGMP